MVQGMLAMVMVVVGMAGGEGTLLWYVSIGLPGCAILAVLALSVGSGRCWGEMVVG